MISVLAQINHWVSGKSALFPILSPRHWVDLCLRVIQFPSIIPSVLRPVNQASAVQAFKISPPPTWTFFSRSIVFQDQPLDYRLKLPKNKKNSLHPFELWAKRLIFFSSTVFPPDKKKRRHFLISIWLWLVLENFYLLLLGNVSLAWRGSLLKTLHCLRQEQARDLST